MDFEKRLAESVDETNALIKPFLPKEEGLQKRVFEAMNYSFFGGGKRLRPIFVLESYRLFGGDDISKVAPFMASIEMIHTYSLIHDDLPAMDNDDYRRGRLTNHKKFDEATAILAGDGLLNYAFETAGCAMEVETDNVILKRMVKANSIMANKAGGYGMIGGQMVDLIQEKNNDADEDILNFIHECKTGALIECALMMGAVLAGASKEFVDKMESIGSDVGHAFQIQDDILDVIGDEAMLGKPVGSDAKNDKVTYVSMKGLKEAQEEQKKYVESAVKTLHELPFSNEFLEELLLSLVSRKK